MILSLIAFNMEEIPCGITIAVCVELTLELAALVWAVLYVVLEVI